MIQKVLIAEDHESANLSVQRTLEELHIPHLQYAYYCDDALIKLKKAKDAGNSFDLLITDLYFDEDHRQVQLKGGQALITAARNLQPEIKVIVFSSESKPAIIQQLFSELRIDGYVRKARSDAKELLKAIDVVGQNQTHYPRGLLQQARQSNSHDFTHFDVTVIRLLTEGKRQPEIAAYLKLHKFNPSGLSSIEKRLNLIRDALNFTTNEQLIAHCVKLGIV